MDDINEYSGDNLGGVIGFKFIPVTDVQSIENPIDHVITTAVVLKTNKRWFSAYATQGTIGYSETSEQTAHGEVFKQQLVAIIPKDDKDKAVLFNKMRNQKFIVDYTDSNGLRKLIGSLEEPLFFSSSANTKTEMSGRNEHSITFYGTGTHKAFIYDF